MQTTLDEAKTFLKENYEEGTICPCCNQSVKLYKRKLTSSMARSLITLFLLNKSKEGYYHTSSLHNSGGGDFTKLKYWDLIEEMKNEDKAKKSSGSWKITEKGKSFVTGNIPLQEKVKLYNNKFWGFYGEEISIVTALNNKFDYVELMRG